MPISDADVKRLISATTTTELGNLLADAVNDAVLTSHLIVQLITATNVSTTVDFAGKLAVGDKVIMIPAVAGNSIFYTVVTAGTLPAAAVVGNLYIVLRVPDTASAVKY